MAGLDSSAMDSSPRRKATTTEDQYALEEGRKATGKLEEPVSNYIKGTKLHLITVALVVLFCFIAAAPLIWMF